MSKPCNSCHYSNKIKSRSGETFFICEATDWRTSSADYVKYCKDYKPKKYNRQETK